MLRSRWRAFIMVVATGVPLSVSFVLTWLAEVAQALTGIQAAGPLVLQSLDLLLNLLLATLLFGAISRTLPDTTIPWKAVRVGAFVTAVLFVAGEYLVKRLIAAAAWTSFYGPGASVVAFVAWVYFSAQLFFLGAEFTQVWARRRGELWG